MTDTPESENMTAVQAPAKLAELTAAFHGTSGATPTTPAEAKARLAALSKDPKWRGDYLAGNVEARQEFGSLTEMAAQAESRLDDVLAGRGEATMMEVTTPEHPLTTRELAAAVASLREDGLSDATIRQVINGEPVSREEQRIAEQAIARLMGDKEWTAKLMAGGVAERRDFQLLCIIKNSPVRK
jgi:hypothetical protein